MLLGGWPLEEEATLGQCGIEALTTLGVAGRMLGGKIHDSLAHTGKSRGQTPKVVKLPRWSNRRRRRRQAGPSAQCSTTVALSTLCLPLPRRRAPVLIPKSYCDLVL